MFERLSRFESALGKIQWQPPRPGRHDGYMTPQPGTAIETFIDANRQNWNDRTQLHAQSAFYDLDGFLAGANSIGEHEQAEVGPVHGKRLLHMQCHFGMDTLSLARLGATVTGVDIADEAITLAQSLARQLDLPARFLRANIYDLPEVLDESFDIVYATYGVLCWIPDITQWAQIAARHLDSGGVFYLADGHPLTGILRDDRPDLDTGISYFHRREPFRFEQHGSYTGDTDTLNHPVCYEWQHSLGEIITAVLAAGLRIDFVHEFNWATYQRLPQMRQASDGRWHLPGDPLPLTFSIRATKP